MTWPKSIVPTGVQAICAKASPTYYRGYKAPTTYEATTTDAFVLPPSPPKKQALEYLKADLNFPLFAGGRVLHTEI